MDLRSPAPCWVEYSRAKDDMFTYTGHARQSLVRGGRGRQAPRPPQLHLPTCSGKVPYEAIHYEPIKLPSHQDRGL